MKNHKALGITDDQLLAAMMEAGLKAKLTLHKAEGKDGESQVLGHIIDLIQHRFLTFLLQKSKFFFFFF